LWDDILQYQVDADQMTFNFEYRREGRKPRWVHIFTPYVRMLHYRVIIIITVVESYGALCME